MYLEYLKIKYVGNPTSESMTAETGSGVLQTLATVLAATVVS